MVLKSREGEGLASVGLEVSDRLDWISGQYSTAIQRDLVPVEMSLGLVRRGDIVRAHRSASKSVAELDA